jgi:hypothetical protein
LVKVQNANTAAPAGQPQFTGWCLDKEDLCVAKLCAFREKDRNFVAALLEAGLVDAGLILERLLSVEERRRPDADRAVAWLESWKGVVLTLGVLRRGSPLVPFEVPSPGIFADGACGARRTRWASSTARLP